MMAKLLKDLNKFLLDKYKVDGLVLSLTNYQVNFNYKTINYLHLSEDTLKKDCISFLEKRPEVAFVVDMKKAATAPIPEALRTRIVNGYNAKNSGEIQII